MSVSASTVVTTPASTIFDILADPRQHQRIDGSGTLTGKVTGPQRLELGAEFAMSMKQGAAYTTKNKVIEFESDRLIAWKHFAPQVWRYELEVTSPAATRVTETWDLSGYPALVRPIISAIFAKRTKAGLEATLVKLKSAAEQDAGIAT